MASIKSCHWLDIAYLPEQRRPGRVLEHAHAHVVEYAHEALAVGPAHARARAQHAQQLAHQRAHRLLAYVRPAPCRLVELTKYKLQLSFGKL